MGDSRDESIAREHSAADTYVSIQIALAGHLAERVIYGNATFGDSADLQSSTQMARQLIVRGRGNFGLYWGDDESLDDVSRRDREIQVRRIIRKAEKETYALLRKHRRVLQTMADAMVAEETLDQKRIREVVE